MQKSETWENRKYLIQHYLNNFGFRHFKNRLGKRTFMQKYTRTFHIYVLSREEDRN